MTTTRLAVYLRCLNALDAVGVTTISSNALADQFLLNAAQIRKDLACFGEFGVRIAVIAVPASSAQPVVNRVVASGIKAVLNFSPGRLRVPRGVKLKNVDLTVALGSLSFHLARGS